MKKTVFKTLIISLCVIALLGVAAFGLASLISPRTMMDFTAQIGLDEMSGDFAYREYERSGDVDCLARSFLIAAENAQDKKADERFEKLYADPGFDEHCKEQDAIVLASAESDEEREAFSKISYRSYVCGVAARVRYRLHALEGLDELIAFAAAETDDAHPDLCAAYQLAEEAASAGDRAACEKLLQALGGKIPEGSQIYSDIERLMEEGHA